MNRPSAMVVDPSGSKIFVANAAQATIAMVARSNFEPQAESLQVPASVVDMVGFGHGSKALTISDNPPSLSMVDFNRPTVKSTSLSLNSRPARLATSVDQKCAVVTMTWERALVLIQLNDEGLSVDTQVTRIELEFPPKDIIAIGPTKFLISDAFGGSLAILDAGAGQVVAQHQIQGHHIGGLCWDESTQTVLISHQRLSTIAETNYDDIHWGTLMQNLVSQVAIQSLLEPTAKINAKTRLYRLGNPGKGTADPAGIVSWPDGRFAVAIAGGNEVAFGKLGENEFQFVAVGAKPTRILALGEAQLLCINELDNTISVIDKPQGGEPSAAKTIGEPKRGTSLAAQGELDFYSGRLSHDGWMSCSSCHVDGFTPDLVSDTFGDGGFGNAKRIPSLFGATATGPWGWNGRKKTLEEQIKATLTATMHRDAYQKQDTPDDEIIERLVSYIETLDSPVRIASAENEDEIRLGSTIFQARECSKCHDPSARFTSADVYDIGVTDEFGQSKFNPPSLSNLNARRAFFHDGRFQSLDEVLKKHPQDDADLSELNRQQLKAFLLSL